MKTSIPSTGFFALALLSILLSGCRSFGSGPMGPGSLTPEAATVQTIVQSNGTVANFQLEANSVNVRQSIPVGDHFVVVAAFRGLMAMNEPGGGPQRCLFTYEVLRARLGGWVTSRGGGSCTSTSPQNGNLGPMSIGASNNSGSGPGSAGYSSVEGEVYQNDIITVQVSWNDGKVENIPVVNGTYITVRPGNFQMVKVDGLNEAGQAVFTSQPQTAPGKEQQ